MTYVLFVCADSGHYNTLEDFLEQTEAQTESNLRQYVRNGQGRGIDGKLITSSRFEKINYGGCFD